MKTSTQKVQDERCSNNHHIFLGVSRFKEDLLIGWGSIEGHLMKGLMINFNLIGDLILVVFFHIDSRIKGIKGDVGNLGDPLTLEAPQTT